MYEPTNVLQEVSQLSATVINADLPTMAMPVLSEFKNQARCSGVIPISSGLQTEWELTGLSSCQNNITTESLKNRSFKQYDAKLSPRDEQTQLQKNAATRRSQLVNGAGKNMMKSKGTSLACFV